MSLLDDFYPTKPETIRKLVEGVRFGEISTILEPSAGKGDIAEYLKTFCNPHRYREFDLDCVEINPELQHILRGKGFRVVHDDFLTYETRKSYDLIVANFPFSEGEHHLHQALRLLERTGGTLRCLVNAETIKNPYTKLRQVVALWLDELNVEIEFLEDEFIAAERPTKVEVALVKATLPRPEPISIILTDLKRAEEAEVSDERGGPLVEADFLKQIVRCFQFDCDAGVRLLKEYFGLKPSLQDALIKPGQENYSSPLIKVEIDKHSAGDSLKRDINEYLRGMRRKYWAALLHDERFRASYTSNILKEMERKLEELKDYDFSVFNIRQMQEEMNQKIVAGIESAILELFDTFSRKHAYGEDFGSNIWYFNGWKTNQAHCVNRKVILPMYGLRSHWDGGRKLSYDAVDKLTDMVKVFNYLARHEKRFNVRQIVGSVCYQADKTEDFNLDLRYFKIKIYKKGTVHITFTDQELLDKFNIFGCQRKGWLPPAYGRKRYEEMNAEEQAVVDSFHKDQKPYEAVIKDSEFYLVESRDLLMLGSGEEMAA